MLIPQTSIEIKGAEHRILIHVTQIHCALIHLLFLEKHDNQQVNNMVVIAIKSRVNVYSKSPNTK
jgi:hypothetical protein